MSNTTISESEAILRLRASLRAVTDAYDALLDEGFPKPKRAGRDAADDVASYEQWWEDSGERAKRARQVLADTQEFAGGGDPAHTRGVGVLDGKTKRGEPPMGDAGGGEDRGGER